MTSKDTVKPVTWHSMTCVCDGCKHADELATMPPALRFLRERAERQAASDEEQR